MVDKWEHGGHPYYAAPAEFEKWNPVNYVDKWETPQLVITSERDFRIPYTQGIAAFTALQRQNIPSRLLIFPDENHWVLKPKNSVQWYDEVFAGCAAGWGRRQPRLRRHLPRLPPPSPPNAAADNMRAPDHAGALVPLPVPIQFAHLGQIIVVRRRR